MLNSLDDDDGDGDHDDDDDDEGDEEEEFVMECNRKYSTIPYSAL